MERSIAYVRLPPKEPNQKNILGILHTHYVRGVLGPKVYVSAT